jgi:hypothetical protein
LNLLGLSIDKGKEVHCCRRVPDTWNNTMPSKDKARIGIEGYRDQLMMVLIIG